MWLLLASCRDPDPPAGDSATPGPPPACVPAAVAWPEAVTTLSETRRSPPPVSPPLPLDPAWPDGLAAAQAAGLGGFDPGPGEPWLLRDELLPGHAVPRAGRRSTWMVFHETDAQIADTESPTRLAAADAPSSTEAAARPQELYALHALDALIRRADDLHAAAPIDFAVATGDDADSTQANEVAWFAAVWDGTPVRPDAGVDDAQPDEDCNDPIEAFTPVGAAFPWYAVAGNHDVLVQGNFDIEGFVDDALGTAAFGGTRDLSEPGGPLAYETPADPARVLLDRAGIADAYLSTPSTPGPPGHGFGPDNVALGRLGWSARPVAEVPVRLVSVDANPDGFGAPVLTATERDGWLLPQLLEAEAAGELVVLTSHYALGEVALEGGGALRDLLLAHPNVILVLAGHTHEHRVRAYPRAGDAGGFWQIETSATVDWPGQGRLVELVDNGDGSLSIVCTVFDYPVPDGSLAARAAELMRIDWQSGWRTDDGVGTALDRNVELLLPLPPGVAAPGGRPGVRSEALP